MSSTEIVKATIERGLESLRERANAITVVNQQEYIAACNLVLEGRSYVKDVKAKLGPGIDSAKQHLDFLKNDMAKYIVPADEIIKIAERKAEAWKADERRKAQEEQDRINAEAKRVADAEAAEKRLEDERIAEETKKAAVAQIRSDLRAGRIGKREAEKRLRLAGANEEAAKAAASAAEDEAKAAPPPAVKVEAAVPKVSGIKGRVNYKFEIIDAKRIPVEFLMPNEVKIGAIVREMKNPAKSMQFIPGIRVWEEDSI